MDFSEYTTKMYSMLSDKLVYKKLKVKYSERYIVLHILDPQYWKRKLRNFNPSCFVYKRNFSRLDTIYSMVKANLDSSKNMLLLKNLQFVPNHCETLSQ